LLGQHVRHVKFLKTDAKVQQLVGSGPLARVLSNVGNWVFEFQRATMLPDDIEFSVEDLPFVEEFATRTHTIEPRRSVEYLNWRFRRHPLKRYHVMLARRRSETLGHGVIEIDGSDAIIAEIDAADPQRTIPGILAY